MNSKTDSKMVSWAKVTAIPCVPMKNCIPSKFLVYLSLNSFLSNSNLINSLIQLFLKETDAAIKYEDMEDNLSYVSIQSALAALNCNCQVLPLLLLSTIISTSSQETQSLSTPPTRSYHPIFIRTSSKQAANHCSHSYLTLTIFIMMKYI